jgi:hypothetical protein
MYITTTEWANALGSGCDALKSRIIPPSGSGLRFPLSAPAMCIAGREGGKKEVQITFSDPFLDETVKT